MHAGAPGHRRRDTHELARPFLVLATQNPVEYEGTYPLPEAQVDRFMVRLSLGYPDAAAEAGMLAAHEAGDRVLELEPVATAPRCSRPQDAARRVHASRALRDYIVALLRHTREDPRVELGASPRAGPDAAARRQGARDARRAATTRCPTTCRRWPSPCSPTGIVLAPEAAGVERSAIVADAVAADARAVGVARCAPPSGAPALGLLLLLVAGMFDAEPLYVPARRSPCSRSAPPAGSPPAPGAPGRARARRAAASLEEEPLAVRDRGAPPAGCRCRPAGSRAAAARAGALRPAAGARACASRSRFARRGLRRLAPPALVLRDPLGLAQRVVARHAAATRCSFSRASSRSRAAGGGGRRPRRPRRADRRGRVEIDGLRPYREGAPASRIHWPARGARRRADGAPAERRGRLAAARRARPARARDARRRSTPPSAPPASLARALAAGGCALLLPGDRRADGSSRDLLGLAARARAAGAGRHRPGPALAAAQNRRGLVVLVAARPVDRPPRGLGRTPGGACSSCPATLPSRRAVLEVAGCEGYAGRAAPAATAAVARRRGGAA